jgi:hypothetical protein
MVAMHDPFDSFPADLAQRLKAIQADNERTALAIAAGDTGNIDHAVELAREIQSDWKRCQALASIAGRAAGRSLRLSLIEQAFDSAKATTEPNRIVSVGAWPARVLCDFGYRDHILEFVDRLVRIAETEPHPVRRADALYTLWCHLRLGRAPEDVLRRVLDLFLAAAAVAHGWRRDRELRDVAVLLARMGWSDDAHAAQALIERPRVRRQAAREMATPSALYSEGLFRPVYGRDPGA